MFEHIALYTFQQLLEQEEIVKACDHLQLWNEEIINATQEILKSRSSTLSASPTYETTNTKQPSGEERSSTFTSGSVSPFRKRSTLLSPTSTSPVNVSNIDMKETEEEVVIIAQRVLELIERHKQQTPNEAIIIMKTPIIEPQKTEEET